MKFKSMKFSLDEIKQIIKSLFVVTLIFTIPWLREGLVSVSIIFLISLFTVGIGFLVHEMSHKYFAQKYGCIARYQSDDRNLLFSLILSFTGFIFLAPGAVFIQGHINNKKRGIITLAGPVSNILLSIMFLIGIFIFRTGFLSMILRSGYDINSYLAFFNMIPIANLDGKKIFQWNKQIYFFVMAISAIFLFFIKI